MEEVVKELMDVLDQEAKLYDDILKISKNKTSIIVEGKVTELEKIVKLEQSLVLQMAKLENQRENLIDKISKHIGIKPEDITISSLIKFLGKDQSEKMKTLQNNIVKTVKDLSDTNGLNSKLIKNSLDFISFSLNMYANAGNEDNNYGLGGRKIDGKERNFFDLKI